MRESVGLHSHYGVKSQDDLPAHLKKIYSSMATHMKKKDLDELLCGELISRDHSKCGYLSIV